MKAGEIVILAEKLMEVLSKADIKMSDWRYAGVYIDYEKAVESGEKVSAAVAGMAEKYGMSEASVWRVVRRMRKEVVSEVDSR